MRKSDGTYASLLVLYAANFANSLDLDQAQCNAGSDLNPNCLTLSTLMVFLEVLFEKLL